HLCLTLHTWRGKTALIGTVVIDTYPQNLRIYCITVFYRFLELLENYHASAIAKQRSRGIGIKRLALGIRTENRSFLIQMSAVDRRSNRTSPGQGYFTLPCPNILDCLGNGQKRSRASRIDTHGRP